MHHRPHHPGATPLNTLHIKSLLRKHFPVCVVLSFWGAIRVLECEWRLKRVCVCWRRTRSLHLASLLLFRLGFSVPALHNVSARVLTRTEVKNVCEAFEKKTAYKEGYFTAVARSTNRTWTQWPVNNTIHSDCCFYNNPLPYKTAMNMTKWWFAGSTDLLSHAPTGPQGSQLWRHRQGFSTGDGLRDGHAWMMSTRSHDARRTAHLLGQEHGAIWQFVWLGARLLPHRDLLG